MLAEHRGLQPLLGRGPLCNTVAGSSYFSRKLIRYYETWVMNAKPRVLESDKPQFLIQKTVSSRESNLSSPTCRFLLIMGIVIVST